MRDRAALAVIVFLCLTAGAGAVFDLRHGDDIGFWWFVVILCLAATALVLQLRHQCRQRTRR